MSDPTPTPAPAPAAKTPKPRGLLDKHQLAEISRANTIYGVANDPATFAKIQDDQIITPAFMAALGKDLQEIGQYTGDAAAAATAAKLDTRTQTTAKKTLLAQIHYLQSKAKLIYAANKAVLHDYSVGDNLTLSRPVLETAAGNILNKLKTDTLPKVSAQHSTNLQAALDAYKKTKVDQVGGKSDATDLRGQLAAKVVSLATRRRQLQHAADGEAPFTDPANAGTRKKSQLPPDRPLNP